MKTSTRQFLVQKYAFYKQLRCFIFSLHPEVSSQSRHCNKISQLNVFILNFNSLLGMYSLWVEAGTQQQQGSFLILRGQYFWQKLPWYCKSYCLLPVCQWSCSNCKIFIQHNHSKNIPSYVCKALFKYSIDLVVERQYTDSLFYCVNQRKNMKMPVSKNQIKIKCKPLYNSLDYSFQYSFY